MKLIFVHQDGGSRAQDAQEHSRRARVMDVERLMGGNCSEDSWAGGGHSKLEAEHVMIWREAGSISSDL